MREFRTKIPLGCMMLMVVACTQDPAPIDYKGSGYYGTNNTRTSSPVYSDEYVRQVEQSTPLVSKAEAPSVGVSDLPPPSASSGKASPAIAPSSLVAAPTDISSASLPPPPVSTPGTSPPLVSPAAAPAEAAKDKTISHNLMNSVSPLSEQSSQQFVWPLSGGTILARFGGPSANDGINIEASEGDAIRAIAGGTVVYASDELKDYGNMVILRHPNGWMSAYAHASAMKVKKGDAVGQGDTIATVGKTGAVQKPQLHFVLRRDKTPVDPEKYITNKS